MHVSHIRKMKVTEQGIYAKRIKVELGTDDRVVTTTQGHKLKGQLPADLLSQKVKYNRPPKEASTTEVTPTLITLCIQL